MKTERELIEDARVLLFDLVKSREFLLYIGADGSYHNRIKKWFEETQEQAVEIEIPIDRKPGFLSRQRGNE